MHVAFERLHEFTEKKGIYSDTDCFCMEFALMWQINAKCKVLFNIQSRSTFPQVFRTAIVHPTINTFKQQCLSSFYYLKIIIISQLALSFWLKAITHHHQQPQ